MVTIQTRYRRVQAVKLKNLNWCVLGSAGKYPKILLKTENQSRKRAFPSLTVEDSSVQNRNEAKVVTAAGVCVTEGWDCVRLNRYGRVPNLGNKVVE